MSDDFNIGSFQQDAPVVAPGLPRPRRGEKFFAGPVPWSWIAAAGRLRGAALHVGVVLWHLAKMKNTACVRLSLGRLREMGIPLSTAARALRALERAGLVSARRHPGRAAIVTILEAPEPPLDGPFAVAPHGDGA